MTPEQVLDELERLSGQYVPGWQHRLLLCALEDRDVVVVSPRIWDSWTPRALDFLLQSFPAE